MRDGRYNGTSAALEFAVQHLQVGRVIVLGHAHCGGIRMLFQQRFQDEENEAGSGQGIGHNSGQDEDAAMADGASDFVAPWMSLVRSAFLRVEGTMLHAPEEVKAKVCEQAAVLVSLENLMTFTAVREGVRHGSLQLHGW